jgi:curved DNA-binding protein CbpA
MKKYYDILGLDMAASIEEIAQAYKELSETWNPQTYQNLPRSRRKAEIKLKQMVRYYGYYSNASRGRRKKAGRDNQIPCILEPALSSKQFRKNWTRLIQKIYEVD